MSKSDPAGLQNSGTTDAQITGPHQATDSTGQSYRYWRCESCNLETTDTTIETHGCWRCQE